MDEAAAGQELIAEYDASIGVVTPGLELPEPGALLSARVPAATLALASVATVEAAADRLRQAMDLPRRAIEISAERVAAAVSSDRLLRVDGRPIDGFAPLSGFFATADGWIRTHANYPHHRRRLLAALGLPDSTDRDAFVGAVASRNAQEVEDLAVAGGAIAVRVRREDEWAESEPGKASRQQALVEVTARPGRADGTLPDHARTAARPLAGLRVLDLTRVIAGPVATRTLALLGAQVLRVDPTALDEIGVQHTDTGQGKTTTQLDLDDPTDRTVFDRLLASADVLVTGYRPGALEALGLDTTGERPGLIRARVSAWGTRGPWAHRRGFDSIVQAASGIAVIEGTDPDGAFRTGALPAQVLDHSSGYLLAAAVVDALARRMDDGLGRDVEVALARTAAWLLDSAYRTDDPPPAVLPGESTTVTHGDATTARPALLGHDDYPFPARPWGADAAAW